MKRRDFLKVVGYGTAGTLFLGGGIAGVRKAFAQQPLPQTSLGNKQVTTFCEICFWKCGTVAHVEDGTITKLTGNQACPLCNGRLCPRGTGGLGALYDPDRLAKPLIRVNKRGQDEWEAVSWEKALDHIAKSLNKIKAEHGPEAVALFSHGTGGGFFAHLLNAFGSPNIAQPSFAQCRGPRDVGFELTYGEGIGSPERYDILNAKMIVLIGSHLGENMHNTQVQEFSDAVADGAELVVVDPRFSVAASKAKRWLPIKPGTDLALLLAWIHVILEEELYDKAYIAQNAMGLAELKKAVAGNTPEWAYPHTGIPAETIREVARDMATFKPATLVHAGRFAAWHGDDTQRSRAIAILAALLGSWGREGGYCYPTKAKLPKYPYPPYPESKKGGADGGGTKYPFASEGIANGLRDATNTGKPYPIKAWIIYGTNLIQSIPNPTETIEALKKLDFVVAIDTMPAEITGWADVILPECTYLERYDELWAPGFRTPFISLRQPVVEPMYDSKPGWWIARELGLKLGLAQYFPWKNIEEYLDLRLKKAGFSLEQLKKEGTVNLPPKGIYLPKDAPAQFGTESGKIELFSHHLAKAGFDAVPRYTPPEPNPAGFFRLLQGRSPVHTFGRTTNNRLLAEIQPENEVWVNTDMAKDLEIENEEYVVLVNLDGVRSNPVKAKVTERIHPDAVFMVHGFGHTSGRLKQAHNRGADDAALLTRYKVDPLMGGTAMRGNFVRLEKVNS